MAERKDLLVEVGTEELPPKSLLALSQAFAANFEETLRQQSLGFRGLEAFATPRRLALLVNELDTHQADQETIRRGPSLQAAFDAEGSPTKAVQGFASSCGVTVDALQREETPKGAWVVYRQTRRGQSASRLVPQLVEQALAALPIPKRMRWGDGEEEFVRPVHWIVLLFGSDVVEGRVLGEEADRLTRGHRFHHPDPIRLARASDYAKVLRREGRVEPSFSARSAEIVRQLEGIASAEGGVLHLDPELLREATALCEWPVALLGGFEEKYLGVPSEVLIETMQSNQKYFPIFHPSGRLLPMFITISNIESRNPTLVRAGNERVIRPRFADAAFFCGQDLKHPLETLAQGLGNVVFQEKLGTLAEKADRVAVLARRIAEEIGLDPTLAERASHLAKADLLSNMVAEFPSLQGTMGRYYAEKANEDPCVAAAMEEQYLPRKAGDRLPTTACGRALAIADRLDTLVGIFAIGQRPTGVKDPYALRRAALGVLRILIETPLPLNLRDLIDAAGIGIEEKLGSGQAAHEVFAYMMERLVGYYQEWGIAADVVDAVLARGISVPSDIDARVRAVHTFRNLPEAESLAAANKRIRNILRRTDDEIPERPDPASLVDPSERVLAERVERLRREVEPALQRAEYSNALATLAALKSPVDAFFDEVMVMVDDARLRRNRLALLQSLEGLFLQVADLSRLQ